MRIAFLVGRFPSLSETFVLSQITGLIDRGHDVQLFARRPDPSNVIHEDIGKYRLLDRVTYGGTPSKLLPRLFRALGLFFTWVFREPRLIFRTLNVLRFRREASSFKLLFWADAFLRHRQRPGGASFDIVQAHFGPNGLLALRLRDLGILPPSAKIVTAFHGYDVYRYPAQHGEDVYRELFARGERILPISDLMKGDLIALGCPPDKIIVHHMGTDPCRFRFHARQPPSDGVVRLVSIARLVPKKGLEFALRAVSELQTRLATDGGQGVRLDYRIVGDGPERPRLAGTIEELGLGNIVSILGWRTHEEVNQLLEESHIVLTPSVTAEDGDREGNPVSLMEALAKGLPVVSTYHSAIPELVRDGVNGYLVPERDVGALADKLHLLVTHPESWAGLGSAGRAIVEAEYATPTLNDRLVNIYQELLRG
jgi:colanic acid/amylovoran biosynthesis glycosyltransferase